MMQPSVTWSQAIPSPSAPFVAGLGQAPEFRMRDDIVAGAVGFGLPLAYHYGAPKKWPRYGRLANVGAAIGLYFVTRWALMRWGT